MDQDSNRKRARRVRVHRTVRAVWSRCPQWPRTALGPPRPGPVGDKGVPEPPSKPAGVSGCGSLRGCLTRRPPRRGGRTRTCCRPTRIRHHGHRCGGRRPGPRTHGLHRWTSTLPHRGRRHGLHRSTSSQPHHDRSRGHHRSTRSDRPHRDRTRRAMRRHGRNRHGRSSDPARPDGPGRRSVPNRHGLDRPRTP